MSQLHEASCGDGNCKGLFKDLIINNDTVLHCHVVFRRLVIEMFRFLGGNKMKCSRK